VSTGGIGRAALALASIAAVVAAVLAVAAVRSPTGRWQRRAALAYVTAVIAAVVAVGALAWGLVTMDFSLSAVAETASRSTTWPYRLAGLWGAMAGSLLWWSALLGVAGAIGWRTARRRFPVLERSVAVIVATAFAAFVTIDAAFANPFHTLDVPSLNGDGLVPILRHPAMLYHPPIVYVGLTALVVPFALSLAAVASSAPVDNRWVHTAVAWLTGSWVLLTVGMAAGGHWAYAEQGWGGFWAWDPVENGVLLPWLVVTAAVHLSLRRRTHDRRTDIGLAALTSLAFGLACLGALLTRSGAAESVHAFAEARAVGRALLVVVVGGAVAVAVVLVGAARRVASPAALETAEAQPPAARQPRTARSLLLIANNVLLLAIAAVVLMGTLTPVVSHVLTGSRTVVDAHYYGVFTAPLAAVGLLLALASLLLAHRSAAAVIAHVGLTLVLVGAAASATGTTTQLVLAPGEQATVRGWTVALERFTSTPKDDHVQERTDIRLHGHGEDDVRLRPGIDDYGPLVPPLAIVALHSTPVTDIQVAVRSIDPTTNRADFDVFVKPMVWWVWWGALLMAAGELLGLVRRRRRHRRPRDPQDPTSGTRRADDPVSVADFAGAGASRGAR
jgi:cytochrome c-type biogenesis protein CcmF